ncbi:MAG: glycosyltransferase family 4 protein [Myxococcales bacterium]|nr:glycosyltransferase family 4 protein [Myxococcales bacterium]
MRILYLSHYFPPEGNAPASRVHELCKRWVRLGHQVSVITCAPNVPDGKVYQGYHNRLSQREWVDGIEVIRVWTYIAANQGTVRRIANYLSYAVTATLRAQLLPRPDIIVATSPQFFCGWAGVLSKWLSGRPLMLEIRDLWPESIVAVGAMRQPQLLALLEALELRMYGAADHITTVGEGYRARLLEKGVPEAKLTVITNGVDRELYASRPPDRALAARLGVEDRFVCCYAGTIGMASGLDIVLRAARELRARGDTSVCFLLVGEGAVRAELQAQAEREGLDNVIFTGRLPKADMPAVLSVADCCLVHLKKTELFETVLPSKLFEALAMRRPVILGVRGDAARVLEESGGGLCIEPEDDGALLEAIERLRGEPGLAQRFGERGEAHVVGRYDRDRLAGEYLGVLDDVARG